MFNRRREITTRRILAISCSDCDFDRTFRDPRASKRFLGLGIERPGLSSFDTRSCKSDSQMSRFLRNELKSVYVRYVLRQVSSKKRKRKWYRNDYIGTSVYMLFRKLQFPTFFTVHCNSITSAILIVLPVRFHLKNKGKNVVSNIVFKHFYNQISL